MIGHTFRSLLTTIKELIWVPQHNDIEDLSSKDDFRLKTKF